MKTLYFTKGPVATVAEKAAAQAISGEVFLRNAEAVGPTDSIEPCDAVAGAVPKIYIDYFKKPDGYFTDAPKNGSTYGRKNGAWSVAEGGGGAGGGLSPSEPAMFAGQILYSVDPLNDASGCAWASPDITTTLESFPSSSAFPIESTASYSVQTAMDANEYGTVEVKMLVEVASSCVVTLHRDLFVRTPFTQDAYSNFGYRCLWSAKLESADGDFLQNRHSVNSYTKNEIAAYLSGVANPASDSNDMSSEDIFSATLAPGAYILHLTIDANSDGGYACDNRFSVTSDTANAANLLPVSTKTQAHRNAIPFASA